MEPELLPYVLRGGPADGRRGETPLAKTIEVPIVVDGRLVHFVYRRDRSTDGAELVFVYDQQ